MEVTIDTQYNVAHIRLKAKPETGVQTLTLSDDLHVDISTDGTVYGIELLNAAEQLQEGSETVVKLKELRSGREETWRWAG
ncbi:DUF2283 domain-containing protein [Larkinella sp. VNQ87]|uniref:DUF2283 domain-containing protein n=1 Tax=Larkinella sp. VNQ87 TaxID=3400921 RepID=UPI003C044BA0